MKVKITTNNNKGICNLSEEDDFIIQKLYYEDIINEILVDCYATTDEELSVENPLLTKSGKTDTQVILEALFKVSNEIHLAGKCTLNESHRQFNEEMFPYEGYKHDMENILAIAIIRLSSISGYLNLDLGRKLVQMINAGLEGEYIHKMRKENDESN